MMWIKKAWDWLKKYWKWILFPVGIIGMVVTYFLGRGTGRPTPVPDPDFSDQGEQALDKAEEANRKRDERLEELNARHTELLNDLTDEQKKEHDQLKEKSIEEVVDWFDNQR